MRCSATPAYSILDEPANGLDPAGIAWLRGFLRTLADEGRTVLVSSHVLTEVQQTVDRATALARGRLSAKVRWPTSTPAPASSAWRPRRLRPCWTPSPPPAPAHRDEGVLRVTGASAAEVGHVAYTAGVELDGLTTEASDLEKVFLDLTGDPAPAATDPGSVA